MKSISAIELKDWKNSGKNFQLIDIREQHERLEGHLDGISIPMDCIIDRVTELRKDCPVVIHCRSGKRSAAVVYSLEKKFQLENLYSLEGGYMAYADMDQAH
jgi:rhodanese-related sulfurtransferase